MSEEEKKICQTITEAVSIMHSEPRNYIIGYAEGVIEGYAAARANVQANA